MVIVKRNPKHTYLMYMYEVITNNKELFVPGKVLRERTFCRLVGLKPPIRMTYKAMQKFVFAKVQAYTTLNKILGMRGLAISSRDYYSAFVVLPKEEVRKKIRNCRKTSIRKKRYAKNLSMALTTYGGEWSNLTEKELQKVNKFTYKGLTFNKH